MSFQCRKHQEPSRTIIAHMALSTFHTYRKNRKYNRNFDWQMGEGRPSRALYYMRKCLYLVMPSVLFIIVIIAGSVTLTYSISQCQPVPRTFLIIMAVLFAFAIFAAIALRIAVGAAERPHAPEVWRRSHSQRRPIPASELQYGINTTPRLGRAHTATAMLAPDFARPISDARHPAPQERVREHASQGVQTRIEDFEVPNTAQQTGHGLRSEHQSDSRPLEVFPSTDGRLPGALESTFHERPAGQTDQNIGLGLSESWLRPLPRAYSPRASELA